MRRIFARSTFSAVLIYLVMAGNALVADSNNPRQAGDKTSDLPGPTPPPQVDPFAVGTSQVTFNSDERTVILGFLESERRDLERALVDSAARPADALETLRRAMFQVIMSAKTPQALEARSKLIMRIVLVQAYELVFGLPDVLRDPTGRTLRRTPAIEVPDHRTIKVTILRRSIEMALRYHQSDVQAVSSGSLGSLPYVAAAFERLDLAMVWWASVFDDRSYLEAVRTSLFHFRDMFVRDAGQTIPFGQDIIQLDDLVASIRATLEQSPGEDAYPVATISAQALRLVDAIKRTAATTRVLEKAPKRPTAQRP